MARTEAPGARAADLTVGRVHLLRVAPRVPPADRRAGGVGPPEAVLRTEAANPLGVTGACPNHLLEVSLVMAMIPRTGPEERSPRVAVWVVDRQLLLGEGVRLPCLEKEVLLPEALGLLVPPQ